MQPEDIAIADGKIESVRTSSTDAIVYFADWQEVKWQITFFDVLAVENLNVEGEELDRLEVRKVDAYINRVCSLFNEANDNVSIYLFFTPWQEEPRLRVVARDCDVSLQEHD